MRGATRVFWMMTWRRLGALLSIGFLLLGSGGGAPLWAGGALLVHGFPFNPGDPSFEGTPLLFDASVPVSYHVDGGDMAAGTVNNADGIIRVDSMFQVWEDVETAAIEFTNVGPISAVGVFDGVDVDTVGEWDAVQNDCFNGIQSFVVFDADGTLFSDLGFSSGVIGIAGPCSLDPSTGKLTTARAALNGRFQDENPGNGELTPGDFDGAFTHEFGHLFGMDHSQINLNCLFATCGSATEDDAVGLPTMFPFLTGATEGGNPAILTLSEDDRAWVSKFYPETVDDLPNKQVPFNTVYGEITGTVFFSDGLSQAQGVNVIARLVDDPATGSIDESRRFAVSNVSGWRYTDSPGQQVTGTNNSGGTWGGRARSLRGLYSIPVPVGEYTVEVEEVFSFFVGGSSVGPLVFEQIPLPGGVPEFYSGAAESDTDDPAVSQTVTVTTPGTTISGIDIILNGTDPRFDPFELAYIVPGPNVGPAQPMWLRDEDWELPGVEEVA